MKQQDHATLEKLLLKLILAQERVDAARPGPVKAAISAIRERHDICQLIYAFVDGLVSNTTVQQSADIVTGTLADMKIDRLG